MQNTRPFHLHALLAGMARAVTPLLTRQLFYGIAVSCALGLGVGAWLQPQISQARQGAMQPVAILAPPAEAAEVSYPAPYTQTAQPVEQVAEVSPATDDAPLDRSADTGPQTPPPIRAQFGPPLHLEDPQPDENAAQPTAPWRDGPPPSADDGSDPGQGN